MLTDSQRQTMERALTWVLTLALLAALVGVVYVAVTPEPPGDPYTEFYVLGPNGTASGYPTNLSVGERGEFIVGISNHEHRQMEYTVVVATTERIIAERTLTVANDATWEDRFVYTPEAPGQTKLRILLYRGNDPDLSADPYRRLRLIINVSA